MRATSKSIAVLVIVLVLHPQPTRADDKQPNDRLNKARQLAMEIDLLINAQWEAAGVTPAAVADDDEFLRRIYLDITGRIPTSYETRTFLANTDPQKRYKVAAELVESSRYVTHFGRYWRKTLLPEATSVFQRVGFASRFENWVRQQLLTNTKYDDFVRRIVAIPISTKGAPSPAENSPLGFYLSKKAEAETYVAVTSRAFLGVRIECVQCHDHPFDTWKREDFYSYAAFFAHIRPATSVKRKFGGSSIPIFEQVGIKTIRIPGTSKRMSTRYLGESETVKVGTAPRRELANWMTSAKKPYFSRAAVNRFWSHFWGRGLVEPFDDLSATNLPTHPEVLDKLATAFAANDFDLKFLIATITSTHAYQLSSRVDQEGQLADELFARMGVKGLTADQIMDSLRVATGNRDLFQSSPRIHKRTFNDGAGLRELFQSDYAAPLERRTSILQALAMMNGEKISDASTVRVGKTLTAIADLRQSLPFRRQRAEMRNRKSHSSQFLG